MTKLQITYDRYDKLEEKLVSIRNYNPSFYPSEEDINTIYETEKPGQVGLYLMWLLLTGRADTEEEKNGRKRVNDFLKEHLVFAEQ